jgi:NADH:ubiquinone oxidoreductase subunit 6 (subunit J)
LDPITVLGYLGVGIVLGAIGQLIRVVVGLKKEMDQSTSPKKWDWFNAKQLWVSLVISAVVGAIAGTLGVVGLMGGQTTLNPQTLVGLITAGYSGTDFIEGFMSKGTG